MGCLGWARAAVTRLIGEGNPASHDQRLLLSSCQHFDVFILMQVSRYTYLGRLGRLGLVVTWLPHWIRPPTAAPGGSLAFGSAKCLKKAPITHKKFKPKYPHFWKLKLPEIPPLFESWCWIFFHLKKFLKFLPKYGEFTFYKIIMTEVSRNLRNIFRTQNTPIFENWRWIFFHLKKFMKFFVQIQ